MAEHGQDDRSPIWTVTKRWRTWYLLIFTISVVFMTSLVAYQETAVNDRDTLRATILAIGHNISPIYIALAIGTAVLVDVLRIIKDIVTDMKGVISLLSDMLRQALRKQAKRRKEAQWQQERIKELEAKLRRYENGKDTSQFNKDNRS